MVQSKMQPASLILNLESMAPFFGGAEMSKLQSILIWLSTSQIRNDHVITDVRITTKEPWRMCAVHGPSWTRVRVSEVSLGLAPCSAVDDVSTVGRLMFLHTPPRIAAFAASRVKEETAGAYVLMTLSAGKVAGGGGAVDGFCPSITRV